jgi:hypothetical protein
MHSVGVVLHDCAYVWHGDVINIPARYTYKQDCKSTTTNMATMRNFEVIILSNRSNNELMFKIKNSCNEEAGFEFCSKLLVYCCSLLFVLKIRL